MEDPISTMESTSRLLTSLTSLVTRVIELAGAKYYDLGMRYEEYLADEARLARLGKKAH